MADVVIKSAAKQALRDASANVQQMAADIWQATPAQIEAGIDIRVTDLQTARDLLTVLTLTVKAQETELRAIKRLLARVVK